MISLMCILVASFFNAMMDSLENENFFESIFRNKAQHFWYKRESWKYAKKVFSYPVDAWHLSKSAMIVFMCIAVYTEQFSNQIWYTNYQWLNVFIDIGVAGMVWNLGFTLFYHRLFRVK